MRRMAHKLANTEPQMAEWPDENENRAQRRTLPNGWQSLIIVQRAYLNAVNDQKFSKRIYMHLKCGLVSPVESRAMSRLANEF